MNCQGKAGGITGRSEPRYASVSVQLACGRCSFGQPVAFALAWGTSSTSVMLYGEHERADRQTDRQDRDVHSEMAGLNWAVAI